MDLLLALVLDLLISPLVFMVFVLFYSEIVGEPLRIIHRDASDYRYTQDEIDEVMKVIKAHEIAENPLAVDDSTYYRALELITKLHESGVDVKYKSKTFLWGKLILYYDVRTVYLAES